jgi:hypothetical protein
MKTSELRIGNFITYCGIIHKVTGISKNKIKSRNLNCENEILYDSNVYEPIAINLEILDKISYDSYHEMDKIDMYTNLCPNFHYGSDSHKIFIYLGEQKTNIEYIHQLQNLYFLLTNKEIIFKL